MNSEPKPERYGEWWNANSGGADWYRQLFTARQRSHDAFAAWAAESGPLTDVLEVGCGCAVRYPDIFSSSRYVGVDISVKEIEWSRKNDKRAWHRYIAGDVEKVDLGGPFDLVFSHAVVDHVLNVEAFIRACVAVCRDRFYFTAYRGWFPELEEHEYHWEDITTCSYNNLSPRRLREFLEELGCTDVEVFALEVNNGGIREETVIRGKAPR